jgi:hypothetical protein
LLCYDDIYIKVFTFADPNRVELEAAMGVEKGKKKEAVL